MAFIKRHKKFTATLAVLLIGTSVAIAAWLVNGTGSGRGGFGALTAPTVSAGTLGSGQQCIPGNDCDGYFSVTNPNASALILTGNSGGGGVTGTPASGPCTFDNLTVNTTSGLTIPVPVGTTTIKVPGLFHTKTTTPTACQNQNVVLDNIPLNFSTP